MVFFAHEPVESLAQCGMYNANIAFFSLTDFVCGRGAAVVLPEEGVDQPQLGEAVLAEAERNEGRRCFKDRSTNGLPKGTDSNVSGIHRPSGNLRTESPSMYTLPTDMRMRFREHI